MVRKQPYCGERHHRAKLTDEQLREILAQPKPAPLCWRKRIARRFGISPYTVSDLRAGRGRNYFPAIEGA
jgi:hypothetical protein